MFEIDTREVTSSLRMLFSMDEPQAPRCFAVLDGKTNKGRILCDHPNSPTWGIVQEQIDGTIYWGGNINQATLSAVFDMLRTGGLLRLWDIVYNFAPAEASPRLEAWCATLTNDVADGWTRADIEEHVRDEHSTFTWLLESMLERCGLQVEEAEYSDDGIFAQYMARAV